MPRNCLGIRLAAQAVLSKIDQKSRNRLKLRENVSICSNLFKKHPNLSKYANSRAVCQIAKIRHLGHSECVADCVRAKVPKYLGCSPPAPGLPALGPSPGGGQGQSKKDRIWDECLLYGHRHAVWDEKLAQTCFLVAF
jgi:hypothetical protein